MRVKRNATRKKKIGGMSRSNSSSSSNPKNSWYKRFTSRFRKHVPDKEYRPRPYNNNSMSMSMRQNVNSPKKGCIGIMCNYFRGHSNGRGQSNGTKKRSMFGRMYNRVRGSSNGKNKNKNSWFKRMSNKARPYFSRTRKSNPENEDIELKSLFKENTNENEENVRNWNKSYTENVTVHI